ncbi:outer membrane beta-barrel protein [Formosa maritima]|uniref:Porin family protein n=1 Tax=Formosa maritima TaxID=2592046 RepID=A0A5D0FZX8_9FLAO|nr:outer membrane beta-barrel protein [Formosa maritima]TYA52266.1 porin family protein [Formosa maritima]
MSDKKHIDRIFQEKFKDFEVSPNPEVWNNIKHKLNHPKKDKKRIIPIWFRLVGVAALLLLMFTVGSLWYNNTSKNTIDTKVVDTEKSTQDSTNYLNDTELNSSLSNSNNAESSAETEVNFQLNNNVTNLTEPSNSTQIASENSKESNSPNNKNTSKNISTDTRITNNTISENKIDKNNVNTLSNNRIAQNNNSKNKVKPNTNKTELNKNGHIDNKDRIAENQNISNNKDANSTTDFDKPKTEEQLQKLNNATENAVAEEENTKAEIEELTKTNLTIEEAIAATQDIIEKEEDEIINRWQVYANIAPVYYNSIGKGSHIDGQFVNNSKTGEVNTSYGVNVSYNLNNKLSIRTGLSSLNLSYDTNDVIIYETVASSSSAQSALKNINLSSGNENLNALSTTNLGVAQIDNSLSPQSNAAISQRISYYEVPVELNYRIGNKKLGLNIIAGFSSFILDGNEVYSELNDKKTYIGEANNINNMSFSTNFGVGLDYKFSEKVKFNLEPTFKYQLNAFENTSGNFNPYIIGIYTGFSYKF